MPKSKQLIFSLILTVVSIAVSLAFAEVFLRVKNSSMRSYDIEMWRYAKELKVRSLDPTLDFEHVKSKAATLQKRRDPAQRMGLARRPGRASNRG